MEEDISHACGFRDVRDYQYFLDKLRQRGMIEFIAPGKIQLVNWEEEQHQFPSWKPEASRDRKRKSREKQRMERQKAQQTGASTGSTKAVTPLVTPVVTPPQNPQKSGNPGTTCNADVTMKQAVTSGNKDVTSLERAYQQEFQAPVTSGVTTETRCNNTDKDTDTEKDLDLDPDQEKEYTNTLDSSYTLVVSQGLNDGVSGKTRLGGVNVLTPEVVKASNPNPVQSADPEPELDKPIDVTPEPKHDRPTQAEVEQTFLFPNLAPPQGFS